MWWYKGNAVGILIARGRNRRNEQRWAGRQMGNNRFPDVVRGHGMLRHRQRAEEAVRVSVDARGEKEGVRAAREAVIAKLEGPQARFGKRLAIGVFELAAEGTGARIVGIDMAIRHVTDEQRVAEPAEVVRGDRHAPR